VVPDALRRAVGDRYDIVRPVGHGGMATVYLATDTKHRRQVAIKVIHPELARTLGADRFLREIEIAAQLQHPNILPLHDSCQDQECLYYVMPFIEGESLRGRLLKEHTLPVDEAVRHTLEIADALSYAHRHEVLHRDIKPENVLLYEGHALVADFGIARAIRTAADPTLTRTGIAIGTPGYMSPEQAAGIRELDERTDVYALACVLYEMLVGETPGLWVTEAAGRLGRFVDASPEHRDRLDRLSGSLEQVLVKALALRAQDRYPGAAEFAEALHAALNRDERYGDTQVRDIIARAAALDGTTPTDETNLSIGGIERAAAEAGIPPARVREAVRERTPAPVAPSTRSRWAWFLGRGARIRIERVVDGEVSGADAGPLIEEVRRAIGNVGHVSTLGTSVAWSTMMGGQGGGRVVQLSITPRGGQTRIYLEEQLSNLAGGLFGGIMGGGGGGGMGLAFPLAIEALHVPALAPVFVATWVTGMWGLARSIFRTVAGRREAELSALADRLADYAEDAARSRLPRLNRPPRLNA
jgi:tRNA A-37 threonylcarbamoyl transferase component Bud32